MSERDPGNPFGVTNRPFWDGDPGPHQEVWYLKMNAPGEDRALWLRFTLLSGAAKQVAEVWAIYFQRAPDGVQKIGLKNTHPISAFSAAAGDPLNLIRIGENTFSDGGTRGEVCSDDHVIRWDFSIRPAQDLAFDFVPAPLRRLGLVRNTAVNVFEDLRFTGWSEVDGEHTEWQGAPGMQGHLAGPRNGHTWAWAHCNQFTDATGQPVSAIFDGLSARARLGKSGASPYLSTQFIQFAGQNYYFNRMRDLFRIHSVYRENDWRLSAEWEGRRFEGNIEAGRDDFDGVTDEDTDGSALYCYNSKMSSMTLDIYHRDTLEQQLISSGGVAYEFVTRTPIPDIPLLI